MAVALYVHTRLKSFFFYIVIQNSVTEVFLVSYMINNSIAALVSLCQTNHMHFKFVSTNFNPDTPYTYRYIEHNFNHSILSMFNFKYLLCQAFQDTKNNVWYSNVHSCNFGRVKNGYLKGGWMVMAIFRSIYMYIDFHQKSFA